MIYADEVQKGEEVELWKVITSTICYGIQGKLNREK
jgi:hypothetical protein